MPKKGYRSITLPEDVVEMIEKIIQEHRELGYRTIAEFVRDALRCKMKELKREGIDVESLARK